MKIHPPNDSTLMNKVFMVLIWLTVLWGAPTFAQAPEEAVDQNSAAPASSTTDEEISAPEVEAPENEALENEALEKEAPEEEAPPYSSRHARDSHLLAQANADEALWLDTPEGKMLALFRASESRVTKGTLVLLHAAEMPPGWPVPLENLRRNLPRYGWQTLAITLPEPEGITIPARELPVVAEAENNESQENSENQENNESEAVGEDPTPEANTDTEDQTAASSTDDAIATGDETPVTEEVRAPAITREELIAQRIQAALQFLAQNDVNNIALLVDNSSINPSMDALSIQAQIPAIRALILTNIQPQEALTPAQLTAAFSAPQLPVLDVFTGPNSEQQRSWRQRHRAQAMRNQIEVYQQFVMPSMQSIDINDAQSFWLDRIRGFLERHGKE